MKAGHLGKEHLFLVCIETHKNKLDSAYDPVYLVPWASFWTFPSLQNFLVSSMPLRVPGPMVSQPTLESTHREGRQPLPHLERLYPGL